MKEITQFADWPVEVWRRPRQRYLRLRVRPDGRLRITCGMGVPQREILHFLEQSQSFIERSRRMWSEHLARFPAKKFVSGEEFLLHGERCPLEVFWSWDDTLAVRAEPGSLEILAPLGSSPTDLQRAFHRFCRGWAEKHLPARVEFFSRQMDLWPSKLCIRGQRSRWGSCSPRGEVSLNWKLIAAPLQVVDYVVVHELAHLRHLNHSPRFWRLVSEHFADYRTAQMWLRENQPQIAAQFDSKL